MRYRSDLPNVVNVHGPDGHVARWNVIPGEEFESSAGLNHPLLEPLDDEAREHAQRMAEEDLAHARAYHEQWGPSEGRPTPEFPQLEQPPVPDAPPAPARRRGEKPQE